MRTLLILLLLTSVALSQQTHFVPSPATPTIEAATAIALPGDTIQLAAGTYYELVNLPAGVDLAGAGGNLTTIDGLDFRRCIEHTTSGLHSSEIRDLTLAHALPPSVADRGAAIAVFRPAAGTSAVLKLDRCRIRDCRSGRGGAAIGVEDASPALGEVTIELAHCVIRDSTRIPHQSPGAPIGAVEGVALHTAGLVAVDCLFRDNLAFTHLMPATLGGAIHNRGPLVLDGCEFVHNRASTAGGIYQISTGPVNIESCRFIGHGCDIGGAAFTVLVDATAGPRDVRISQCFFQGNETVFGETTIIAGGADVEFSACTVVDDQSTATGSGGIIALNGQSVDLRNCIVTNNGSDRVIIDSLVVSATNCLLPLPSDILVLDPLASVTTQDLLHGLEPAFSDPTNDDFGLRPGSPAVDAGLAAA